MESTDLFVTVLQATVENGVKQTQMSVAQTHANTEEFVQTGSILIRVNVCPDMLEEIAKLIQTTVTIILAEMEDPVLIQSTATRVFVEFLSLAEIVMLD